MDYQSDLEFHLAPCEPQPEEEALEVFSSCPSPVPTDDPIVVMAQAYDHYEHYIASQLSLFGEQTCSPS